MFCKTKNCVLFKLQKWWWDKKIANLCLKKVESVKKGEKEKFGMNLSFFCVLFNLHKWWWNNQLQIYLSKKCKGGKKKVKKRNWD